MLEKALESLLDCKEIQPVHSKGNQSWIFIGRTDAEAEASILWPPNVKNWLIGKDPNAGKKIEGGRRRGQQRMRWFDGITNFMDRSLSKLWVGDGQGGLACCSPWGHKESDTAEWLNWTEIYIYYKCLIGSLFSYYGLKLAVSSFDVCYLFLQSPTLPNMEVSIWFLILLCGLFIRSLEA